ncbi:hypothetical protein [Paraburkholderia sp. MM5477-R1]|uniref:hypothetical protein n=1 Tax=Paraburkholderia sp. MM5477-R1 TaxID=2991062 RepID=UPI003D20A837
MSMECLLLATVVREAWNAPAGRRAVSVRFTDCLGNFAYAECSSTYPATVERLNGLRMGDPIAVRGHVAVVPSKKHDASNLKVSITGLLINGETNE